MNIQEAYAEIRKGNQVIRPFLSSRKIFWNHRGPKVCCEKTGVTSVFVPTVDDIEATDWEIYKEPVPQYNWLEALELMKEGRIMARQSYKDRKYLTIHAYGVDLVRTSLNGTHWSGAEMLVEEMLATDWIVLED